MLPENRSNNKFTLLPTNTKNHHINLSNIPPHTLDHTLYFPHLKIGHSILILLVQDHLYPDPLYICLCSWCLFIKHALAFHISAGRAIK